MFRFALGRDDADLRVADFRFDKIELARDEHV